MVQGYLARGNGKREIERSVTDVEDEEEYAERYRKTDRQSLVRRRLGDGEEGSP
jgi:hypothetical protein